MPKPHPPSLPVTRRAVLTGVVVGAGTMLAGCTIGSERPAERKPVGPSARTAPPDPDVALAAAALAGEQGALDALEATIARHRELTQTLSAIVAAHGEHVSLLSQVTPDDSPAPVSPSFPDQSPRTFAVPAGGEAARAVLSALELALSTSERRQSFAAKSGGFARLLASMAAAAAQQSVLLDQAPS